MRSLGPILLSATPALLLASGAGAEGKKLYLDVHELGPGKVSAADVAAAHQKDLQAEGHHGVKFLRYWVDEAAGKVFCLAEAPDQKALEATHREAHGLMPSEIHEVAAGEPGSPQGGNLHLDVHHVGPGKLTAAQVAGAHQKDLAAQAKHGVNLLDYWFDEKTGTVMCLFESKDRNALNEVHREAHGLVADEVMDVIEGK